MKTQAGVAAGKPLEILKVDLTRSGADSGDSIRSVASIRGAVVHS